MQRAAVVPKNPKINYHDHVSCKFSWPKRPSAYMYEQALSAQTRLFKSLKLWSFYVDLEESLGTVASTKAVYDKILDLRIANAQIIVNYAAFLEENEYFEESFKVCVIAFLRRLLVAKFYSGLRTWSRTVHLPCVV